jgi:hypothetical protein
MDPQKLSKLDPKLRDAYQRVMGTTIPEAPAVAPAQAQTPTPSTTPPISTLQPQSEIKSNNFPIASNPYSQSVVEQSQPATNPQSESTPIAQSAPTPNVVQANPEAPAPATANFANFTAPPSTPQAQTMEIKKKKGIMMPILFGIVGLVFIVIYTFFWTKIFNFKLPFLQ